MNLPYTRHAKSNRAALGAALLLLSFAAFGCGTAQGDEISRERAIEIARAQVSFEPESVEAEKTQSDGRPIWRVTFRRATSPHPMGGIMIVEIDRLTGEVVGLAQS